MYSSLKLDSFHSWFCFMFIQNYIQTSRDNALKRQVNMILTKSIKSAANFEYR